MMSIKHNRIVKAGYFLKLFKHDSQFNTPIFRLDYKRKALQFVIVFKWDDEQAFYVLNRSKKGYSSDLKYFKIFQQSALYKGILAVPAKARHRIQILQVPTDKKAVKDYITYYSQEQIATLLQGELIESNAVYDPFRDAHSAIFHTLSEVSEEIAYEAYQGIQDFHPFSIVDNYPYALACTYQDPIKHQTISLELMGWYYHGKQLKISWKPTNQYKARWRSSLVAIDKKTRRYFFQGNIYHEKGTDPVFLERLTFSFQDVSQNSQAAKSAFERFIQEIKKQEQLALLNNH